MKSKKDWSLTRVLYHLSWMGYWIVVGIALFEMLLFIHTFLVGETSAIYTFEAKILTEEHLTVSEEARHNSYITILPVVEGRAFMVLKNNDSVLLYFYLLAIKAFEFISLFVFFYLLHLLLKNIIARDPFNEKNQRYLFTIGWVFIASEVIALLLLVAQIPLSEFFAFPDAIRSISLSPAGAGSVLLGIIAIVFGYIFKEANRMYEEQKLTV